MGNTVPFLRFCSAIAAVAVPSISRCVCCDSRDPSTFTLSVPTPGETNRCPSGMYKRTVQMHILDAAYEVWVTNPQFTSDLRKQIVTGVNAECKCGFNENYLRGMASRLDCNSVSETCGIFELSVGQKPIQCCKIWET